MATRDLDWDNVRYRHPGTLIVDLTGQDDARWADRFDRARHLVLLRRRKAGVPFVQIVMDGKTVKLSGVPEGEDAALRDELQEIVVAANEASPTH
jgi:hypothetical protein